MGFYTHSCVNLGSLNAFTGSWVILFLLRRSVSSDRDRPSKAPDSRVPIRLLARLLERSGRENTAVSRRPFLFCYEQQTRQPEKISHHPSDTGLLRHCHPRTLHRTASEEGTALPTRQPVRRGQYRARRTELCLSGAMHCSQWVTPGGDSGNKHRHLWHLTPHPCWVLPPPEPPAGFLLSTHNPR